MINKSIDYNESLERMIGLLDGAPATGTSGAGKIYRAWMDLKALVTGGDRATILASCETGEETAIRAYDDALAAMALSETPKEMVTAQRNGIAQVLGEISALKKVLD